MSTKTLYPLSKLKIRVVNFLSSGIRNITSDAFAQLPFLQKLDLSGNKEIDKDLLGKSFDSIQRNHELTLILNRCNLADIPINLFDGLQTSNITNITMRQNHMLHFFTATYHGLKTLRHLDLSVNWIRNVLGNGSEQSGIETLSLANNEFYLFPPPMCDNSTNVPYFPNLTVLDYSNNFIHVPRANDWNCLKKLEKLNLSINAVSILQNDVFFDLKSLKSLEISHMLRKIDIIYPRAFNIPSLKELRFKNNIELFNSKSHVRVTEVFGLLPSLETLDLSGNNLEYLNNSIVGMLSKLTHLRELSLYNTNIKTIPANLFTKFKNLTKLILRKNMISTVGIHAFGNADKLRFLDLSENLIHDLKEDSLSDALTKSLSEINLAQNPFACNECGDNYKGENVWFRRWIDKFIARGKTITDWPDGYRCLTPSSESKKLLRDYKPNPENCKSDNMLIAYITIAVFMSLVIVVGVGSYKARWYLRYWYIKLRWRLQRRQRNDPEYQPLIHENETLYDAYVIYHDTDVAFVRTKLLPVMEDEMKYKLFIRDSDADFGAKVDIIVDNIYKSNNVIAVISRRFLKDQWCAFQLDVTMDRRIELKRDFLLLVSLEDVDKQLLSKSWCVLFTKTPTAEWCERRNDIKRKVFERQIQVTISNTRFPNQSAQADGMDD